MTKSQANNYGGVRKKLMGAVAMLLVASIMVVSSTYAWFTLSTAPEITGISTSVGANGNLEIALLNNSTGAEMSNITSAVGDSSDATGRTVTEANITWGNLVDLSDISYGTSKFVLNPARLNLNGAANALNRAASLMVAEYGTDGRVTKLKGNTITGLYNGTVFAGESETNVEPYGVRAIGVAAGMSESQIAFRNARITAASKLLSASNGMATALSGNGAALVNTIIAYANSASTYAPDAEEISNINAIITAVGAAKTNIGDAIRYAQYAYSLSKAETNPLEPTEAGAPVAYTGESLDTFQTSVNAAIAAYNDITVPALLDAEDADNVTKNDVETALEALVDRTHCVIGGKTYAELAAMQQDALMSWGMANIANITVVMSSDNTGALASVAAASANYSAGVSIPGLSVPMGGATPMKIGDAENPIHATLRTEKDSSVTGMSAGLASMSAPAATGEAVTNITDIYGYAVDFAVRTNAADSTLKLQTEAAQRIYSDATNEETTQGGGSYMEFTKDDTLNDTQFEALIGAVRVVFVNGQNEIIAVAVPEAGTLNGATVKAKLKLVDYTITYSGDDGGDNGKINVMTGGTVNYKTGANSADLMTLNQNEATKLTALVYLDGDVVDNSMVSATNAQSMTGKLNLQFSSSADLKPMEYTPLRSTTAQQNP